MVGPQRPLFVLFGSSIVQLSFSNGGWGAILSDIYARKADIITRGYYGWNSRRAIHILDQVFPKSTNKSSKQTMLFPYFERRRRALANTATSKLATVKVISLKSHDKVKEKAAQKKSSKERESYCNSDLHACESLLSINDSRKQQIGSTFLYLKRAGPELPQFLTQLTANIAGAGIGITFSIFGLVVFCSKPFGTIKFLSTGFGLGLVWLSSAIYKLRDTVISITETSCESGDKAEEMMTRLDRNLKHIYFTAAALLAVVLRMVKGP